MSVFSPRQWVITGLLLYTITTALLFSVGIYHFWFDGAVFGIQNWWFNMFIAAIATLLGVQHALRALHCAFILRFKDFSKIDTNNPGEEHIPKYGYRDKWERENL